jgi:hypothetical protein
MGKAYGQKKDNELTAIQVSRLVLSFATVDEIAQVAMGASFQSPAA